MGPTQYRQWFATMESTLSPVIDPDLITITKMFVTPLASVDIPGAAGLNERLAAAILAREAADPGVQHSNDGGWQSCDDFQHWGGPAGEELIDFVKSFANTLSAVWHPQKGLMHVDLDWTYNVWANVNRSGHANAQHAHPGGYWSGVYWVDDGSDESGTDHGGDLEFFDPRGAMPTMLSPHLCMRIEGCLSAGLTHKIKPRTGRLVMFPSWLMHSVTRFTGTRPRMSIALNLAPPMG